MIMIAPVRVVRENKIKFSREIDKYMNKMTQPPS